METKALADKEITIAVLPFKILISDEDLDLVISSFAEDLIINFSKFNGLSVISQYSTRHIQDISQNEMIDMLGADYLITGTFRPHGKGVRLSVQLLRYTDGKVVFAGNHDESRDRILGSQDTIVQQIVSVLQQQIDYDLLSYSYKKETVDLAVYENWLLGMNLLRKGTLESDLEARKYFENALRINPKFARAYTGISLSYFNEWSCQLWDRWDVSQKGAHEYALKAIEQDENDYISLAVLGRTFLYLGAYEKAEHFLRKSLRMNPNDADNLINIANSLVYLGKAKESLALFNRARDLNPLHPDVYFSYGAFISFECGDFEKAVELGEKGRDACVWTDFPVFLAAAHYYLGQMDRMQEYWGIYLESFQLNINQNREASEIEALEWQIRVNPFQGETRLQEFWDFIRIKGKGISVPMPAARVSPPAVFEQQNDIWEISFEGKTVHMRDVKGFHDIRKLIGSPGSEFHCTDLMGSALAGNRGEAALDTKAKASYRKRMASLQSAMAEAEEIGDMETAYACREEYEQLLDHLSSAVGLGGKTRRLGSAVEKARAAVTWRIRSAIQKISQEHDLLGRHLENAVYTGTYCSYRPEKEVAWQL